jgi:hypothetical protein
LKLGTYTPYLLSVIVYSIKRRNKETKKKNSKHKQLHVLVCLLKKKTKCQVLPILDVERLQIFIGVAEICTALFDARFFIFFL